jgi:3-(3-hydroxy-phenyl)propionate hydroxylase
VDAGRVLIAGAGPVGMTAAANLVRRGVPVTVLEAAKCLSEESRASTFHPPTLDMLQDLGVTEPLIAQGLVAPKFQYRARRSDAVAEFDFGDIADLTRHPYRVQNEQFKLTRLLWDHLCGQPHFELCFNSRVKGVYQRDTEVRVEVERDGRTDVHSGAWLIGADGARSAVRRALGLAFEGFTWPERFLVVSTPFDFKSVIAGLSSVSYVADPERWYFLLQIPGLWRVMFPIKQNEDDELALTSEFAQSLMSVIVPGMARYEVSHVTLYKVHQRVASSFRAGRAFVAGDAAHINNPLGGMGMNGGIHDAMNLTSRIIKVSRGEAADAELERYDRQRRLVTLEHIQNQTIRNKQNMESDGDAFIRELQTVAADKARARDYLIQTSMIASLRRASELG